jgi:hypothetical protein
MTAFADYRSNNMKMNRRNFLGAIGCVAAVGAVTRMEVAGELNTIRGKTYVAAVRR